MAVAAAEKKRKAYKLARPAKPTKPVVAAAGQTDPLLDELKTLVPARVIDLLRQPDSALKLIKELPRGLEHQRAWELAGLHLGTRQPRFYEAIWIFEEWYQQLLEYQIASGERVHKGAPLVWIRDFHVNLDHKALAKRFIMLTLIEDALSGNGTIEPERSGVYFRLIWHHGMPDRQLREYAEQIAEWSRGSSCGAVSRANPPASRQALDDRVSYYR